jgi:hypothetical protein
MDYLMELRKLVGHRSLLMVGAAKATFAALESLRTGRTINI